MIVDITSLAQSVPIECDLAVIGGGPAGIALALEFAGDRRKVVLLEAGGLSYDSWTEAWTAGDVTGLPYFPLHETRYRMLGGSTLRWGARTSPLKPIDFASRAWVPASGWPITREALDPYYARTYALIGLHAPFTYDGRGIGGAAPAFSPDAFEYASFQFGRNLVFGNIFRRRLAQAPNVQVVLGATVLGIDATASADHAEGLVVGHRGGGRWTVRAGRYVLAAGGIENARLLLLSSARRPAGLGNGNDLVGRCFMEHPTVSAGTLHSEHWQALQDVFSPGLVRGRLVEVGLALAPGLQQRERTLNAVARTNVVVSRDATQALREILWNARHRRLPLELGWYQKNRWLAERLRAIAADPFSIVGNAIRHRLGKPKRFRVDAVHVELRSEQAPNPDSRIALARDTDPFGQPRAHLHWQLTALDKHTMRVAATTFATELARLGLGRLELAPWLASPAPEFPSDMVGGHHHMGTTRMADDPRRGVVDAHCRMHEVDNVYIAGSSVFPTSGYANPTATLLALALRLADHLKGPAP